MTTSRNRTTTDCYRSIPRTQQEGFVRNTWEDKKEQISGCGQDEGLQRENAHTTRKSKWQAGRVFKELQLMTDWSTSMETFTSELTVLLLMLSEPPKPPLPKPSFLVPCRKLVHKAAGTPRRAAALGAPQRQMPRARGTRACWRQQFSRLSPLWLPASCWAAGLWMRHRTAWWWDGGAHFDYQQSGSSRTGGSCSLLTFSHACTHCCAVIYDLAPVRGRR